MVYSRGCFAEGGRQRRRKEEEEEGRENSRNLTTPHRVVGEILKKEIGRDRGHMFRVKVDSNLTVED